MRKITDKEINEFDIVLVKIGGSILNSKAKLEHTNYQLRDVSASNFVQKIIIICGGGENANFIRHSDKNLKLGDDLAHWLAILAMDYNTRKIYKKLCKNFGSYKFAEDFKTLKSYLEAGDDHLMIFFAPFKYLFKEDELNHSWDVTSDSIALYIANKLNLKKAYLIKDVDGIFKKFNKNRPIKFISTQNYQEFKENDQLAILNSSSDNLKKSQPIDNYLITLIDKYKKSCLILNGAKPNTRIFDYFKLGFYDDDPQFKNRIFTEIISY